MGAFELNDKQLAGVFGSIDVDGVSLDDAVHGWMAENKAVWSTSIN